MNRFLTGIAISAALMVTQACSSRVESEQAPHDHHADTQQSHHPDPHAGHQMNTMQSSTTTEAKLTVPANVTVNQPTLVVINIQDPTGKAIAKFDAFQTKLMHLIVVSDDLQFFDHLHPEYKGNGRFEVAAKFPKPGNYTLFSDYKPASQSEQVSVLKTQVPGKENASTSVADFNQAKTFGNTKVNFTTSEPTIKAGQEVHLMFDLRDVATNQNVKDLQPYLGEKGHLVILQQSPSLSREAYIHAHAMKGTADGKVHFMTQFPQPGKYKLWGQFNRNGKIVTSDFWVNVL
jgi:hypothetical protein